ncbi:MAG TPA: hypothetical protein VGI39_20605 [Polyangiaceae bacterium]
MRKRVASLPADEVGLDEVELVEDVPSSSFRSSASVPASLPPPPHPRPRVVLAPPTPPRAPNPSLRDLARVSHVSAPPPPPYARPQASVSAIRARSTIPPSFPPPAVELDVIPSSRAPFEVPLTERVRAARRRPWFAGVAVAVAAAAVGAWAMLGTTSRVEAPVAASPSPETPHAAAPASPPEVSATPPATPATPAPPQTAGIPSMDVAQLPRSKDGTVIGAEGHRLWIDGSLKESWQATVKCGPHVVQVGSAGTPRNVDVPCGTEIRVAP